MSELKVILATPHPKMKNACDGAIEVYLKSEADKVIADLEESHKKEVEQLLMEIVELKKEKEYTYQRRPTNERFLHLSKAKSCL